MNVSRSHPSFCRVRLSITISAQSELSGESGRYSEGQQR